MSLKNMHIDTNMITQRENVYLNLISILGEKSNEAILFPCR